MSRNYENWERLVEAVLLKQRFIQLALSHSRSSSAISDGSSSRLSFDFSSYSSFNGSMIRSRDEQSDLQSLEIFHEEVMLRSKGSKRLSFFCDINTGKICYLLLGRDLTFTSGYSLWGSSNNIYFRFLGSAIIYPGSSITVHGQLQTKMLSTKVTYAAYLVHTLVKWPYECITSAYRNMEKIVRRGDGWMELKIKEFYVDHGGDNDVVDVSCTLEEIPVMKRTLTVKCFEFRPIFHSVVKVS